MLVRRAPSFERRSLRSRDPRITVHDAHARLTSAHAKHVDHAQAELDEAKEHLANHPDDPAAQVRVAEAEEKLHRKKGKQLDAAREGT